MSVISKIQNLLDPNKYYVVTVHDGDTLNLIGGIFNLKKQAVRLVGINAPELKSSLKKTTVDQPFGIEARDYLRSLVLGKYITYEIDITQGKVGIDAFGRILAHITTEEKQNVNLLMVQKGMAKYYPFNPKKPPLNAQLFERLEAEAKLAKRGIWGLTIT